MENRKRYIKYIVFILILAACWAGNIYYYKDSKVDSAIFIKSYKEADIYGEYDTDNDIIKHSEVDLRLYYIQDINSKDICEIQFPEIGSRKISVDGTNLRTYVNNKLNYIDFRSTDDNFMYILEKKYLHQNYFYVTKMNYWTTDGRKYEIDLGRIYFINEMNKDDEDKPYTHVMSESSSDGTGKCTYKTPYDMSIIGMQSHVKDYVDKYVDVSLDNDNINNISYPKKMNKGKSFDISYKLKGSDDIVSFDMRLNFIVKAGMMKADMPVYIYNDNDVSAIKMNLETIKQLKKDGREAHEVSSK